MSAQIIQFTGAATSGQWFILEVVRKSGRFPSRWTALLIDVEPDDYVAGIVATCTSRWLELGKHKNLDDAWHHAKEVLATWH